MPKPTDQEIRAMIREIKHLHDDKEGVSTSFIAWWIIFGLEWAIGDMSTAELRHRWDIPERGDSNG